jgi:hypothetical protein
MIGMTIVADTKVTIAPDGKTAIAVDTGSATGRRRMERNTQITFRMGMTHTALDFMMGSMPDMTGATGRRGVDGAHMDGKILRSSAGVSDGLRR